MQAADLFCGAGGTSTGLLMAARELGIRLDLVAVNHWELAISTHSSNHPNVMHFNSDLQDVDPRQVVPAGKMRLLVASPECTHFSRARGGKPMNKQSRASVKYVLRWCGALDIDDVLIENVPDFQDWGPLDPATMKPVKSRKGEYFYRFIRKMEAVGYHVDWRILNAADYGDPTTRKRLFIIARKHGAIRWPEPSHHRDGGDMFGVRPRWKPAREIIDWTIKGESIFNRKRPLAENTLRRIWAGLMKYGGKAFVLGQQSGSAPRSVEQPIPTVAGAGAISLIQPFIISTNWTNTNRSLPRSIDDPIPAITSQGQIGLVEPFIMPVTHGKNDLRSYSLDKPMPTVTSVDEWSLVEPFIVMLNGTKDEALRNANRSIEKPLPTVTSTLHHGLVEPFLVEYYGTGESSSVDEPIKTLTGRDRFGLVEPMTFDHNGKKFLLDIRFRMLQPSELARAMSFPKDYCFVGTREQVVKQIGNAVPVNLAKALCKTLLEGVL